MSAQFDANNDWWQIAVAVLMNRHSSDDYCEGCENILYTQVLTYTNMCKQTNISKYTVSSLTVEIDQYLELDFRHFKGLVDHLSSPTGLLY